MNEYPMKEILDLAEQIQADASARGTPGQYAPGDVLTVAAMLVLAGQELDKVQQAMPLFEKAIADAELKKEPI